MNMRRKASIKIPKASIAVESNAHLPANYSSAEGLLTGARCSTVDGWCPGVLASIVFICFMFCGPLSAQAHKVNVFAYVENRLVYVEGYFGGSAKAVHCKVDVLDSAGRALISGKTDDKGLYTFGLADLPAQPGDLKIVLHAGSGHQATYTLDARELPNLPGRSESPPRTTDVSPSGPSRAQNPPEALSLQRDRSSTVPADEAVVRKVVEQALDAKMGPLFKMLGSQQRILLEAKSRGPSLSEIVGGIGWILGIVGVAAYVMSRNRNRGGCSSGANVSGRPPAA